MKQPELEPLVRELNVKLQDVESGELCQAAKQQVQDSICRTLRAYLRTKYKLNEEDHLSKCMGRGQ